ncbi:hypothetical protein Golax_022051, partial [Gossypium laxum]|nr:hypothetical protein [Gossypium laxum]
MKVYATGGLYQLVKTISVQELCPGQQVPMSGGDNTYVATEG